MDSRRIHAAWWAIGATALAGALAPGGTLLMVAWPMWVSGVAASIGTWFRLTALQRLGEQGYSIPYAVRDQTLATSSRRAAFSVLALAVFGGTGWLFFDLTRSAASLSSLSPSLRFALRLVEPGQPVPWLILAMLMATCAGVLVLHRVEYTAQRKADAERPPRVGALTVSVFGRFFVLPFSLLLSIVSPHPLFDIIAAAMLIASEAAAHEQAHSATRGLGRLARQPGRTDPMELEPGFRQLLDAGAWNLVAGNALTLASVLLAGDGARWLIWPVTIQAVIRVPFTLWRMAVMERGRFWNQKRLKHEYRDNPIVLRVAAMIGATAVAYIVFDAGLALQLEFNGNKNPFAVSGFNVWDWVWLSALTLIAFQVELAAHSSRVTLDRLGQSNGALPFGALVARLGVFAIVMGTTHALQTWSDFAVLIGMMTTVELLVYLVERRHLLRVSALSPSPASESAP